MQNPRVGSLSVFLCIFFLPLGPVCPAQTPQDVPRDHWAYAAVEELATKGLVKGYPPDGKFFGERTVTRYEMATIIQRVLTRVEEVLAAKEDKGRPAVKPQPQRLTPAQIDEVRKLTEAFRVELTVIGTDIRKIQAILAELKLQVDAAKSTAEKAASDAAAARKEATDARTELKDLREAFTLSRSETAALAKEMKAHKVSGYLQARFEAFGPGGGELFTPSGSGGTGQAPTTGGPAVGGPKYGFLVRRARLRLSGPITQRTDYDLQLDAPSTGPVAVKNAFVNIARLPTDGVSGRFGLFTMPFGYELPTSSTVRESPERAIGFSDSTASTPFFKTSQSTIGGTVTPGSVLPLFLNQKYDVGAAFTWAGDPKKPGPRLTLGVFNGEGGASSGMRNMNRGLDVMGRAQTSLLGGHLDVGISGYYGSVAVRSAPPTGTTPAPFRNAYRALAGADVRYFSPWGTQFRAEYVGGLFEATPDRALHLENNHVYAWYFTANHPLTRRLNAVLKYDEYYPISQGGKFAAGLGRMDLVRKTIQGGLLYHLDDATRLRLWYARGLTPYDPSVTSGPFRSRLGFFTGEVQVVY
jgi:hypothetical protein